MRWPSRTLLLTVLAACSSSTAPNVHVPRSREVVEGVTLSLSTTPSRVNSRQPVEFLATAHNATDATIQIGTGCGPSFDVVISGPHRYTATALALINPGGAFTCELSPLHFVAARGTQHVRLRIAAPGARGRYHAIAGLRRSDGLSNLSAAIVFEVR